MSHEKQTFDLINPSKAAKNAAPNAAGPGQIRRREQKERDSERENTRNPVTGELVARPRSKSKGRKHNLKRELGGSSEKSGENVVAHGEKTFYASYKNKDPAPQKIADVPSGKGTKWHGHNPIVPSEPKIAEPASRDRKGKTAAIARDSLDTSADKAGRSPIHHSDPKSAKFYADGKEKPAVTADIPPGKVAGKTKPYHEYNPINNAVSPRRRASAGRVSALEKEAGTTGDKDGIDIVAAQPKGSTKFETNYKNREPVRPPSPDKLAGRAYKRHDHNPIAPDRKSTEGSGAATAKKVQSTGYLNKERAKGADTDIITGAPVKKVERRKSSKGALNQAYEDSIEPKSANPNKKKVSVMKREAQQNEKDTRKQGSSIVTNA